jgi:hypothetical protein
MPLSIIMNPELLPIFDEISAVLKKHDVAGVVILSNKTHTDFRMDVSPTWSCAKTENAEDGLMLRVRCKRVDFPSQESQTETLRLTLGAFLGTADALRILGENIEAVMAMIGRAGIEFSHRSTREE